MLHFLLAFLLGWCWFVSALGLLFVAYQSRANVILPARLEIRFARLWVCHVAGLVVLSGGFYLVELFGWKV